MLRASGLPSVPHSGNAVFGAAGSTPSAPQRILAALLQAHRMVLTARPEHTVPSPPLTYGLPRAGLGVKLSGIRPQRTILQPSMSHFSHLAGCCGSD